MEYPEREEITSLLRFWGMNGTEGEHIAVEAVYQNLRRIAHGLMRHERPDNSMEATALVHEAYLRLRAQMGSDWRDRAHFFAAAAQIMRCILVDKARRRNTAKRGGGAGALPLEESVASPEPDRMLMDLNDALDRLAKTNPRQSQIVHLRMFCGMTVAETAELLEIAPRTVARDWLDAKDWLQKELRIPVPPEPPHDLESLAGA